MNITQIRNATQLITYAGKRFLIDPMLAPKDAYPGFPGTARAEVRNPMVELPCEIDALLDVDAIIVTHTHPDHWDETAASVTKRCFAGRALPGCSNFQQPVPSAISR